MIAQVFLPGVLQDQIEKEARTTFPRECCGLVEGVHDEQGPGHYRLAHGDVRGRV